MGVTASTARILAPATFLYDFALQQYGLNSSPNMQDVNDRHVSCFSPQPYFIGFFFFPQQLCQLLWLRELWRKDSEVEGSTLNLVPFYSLGNMMIGTWLPFWNAEKLKGANIFVIVNTFSTLYWTFFQRTTPTTYQHKLTNIVGMSFAGIGVMDFLHNTSIAYFPNAQPSLLVQAATLIGFPLVALFSPGFFGLCLAYDQIALGFGQYQLAQKALAGAGSKVGDVVGAYGGGGGMQWANMLWIGAAATVAATGIRYYRTKQML